MSARERLGTFSTLTGKSQGTLEKRRRSVSWGAGAIGVSREAVGRQRGPPSLCCLWLVVGMHPALFAAPPAGTGTTPIAQFRSPPWGDFRPTLLVNRPYRPDTRFQQIVSQQADKVKKQRVKPGPPLGASGECKKS